MTGADTADDLLAVLRSTPGVAEVYPARSLGLRLLAALDPDGATGATGYLGVQQRGGRTEVEVSVGLDGSVPAPEVGLAVAAAVLARMPGPRADEVNVRIVGFG